YRLTPSAGGPSLAYVTDNELGSGGHYDIPATWRRDLVAFLADADLLIHDAMYTPEELEQHRGWGHSTSEEAVARAADAAAWRPASVAPAVEGALIVAGDVRVPRDLDGDERPSGSLHDPPRVCMVRVAGLPAFVHAGRAIVALGRGGERHVLWDLRAVLVAG